MRRALLLLLLCVVQAFGATRYIDNSLSTGANDGTSWANAWRTLAQLDMNPGDIIYISGGPSGGSQTYNLVGELTSLVGWGNGSSGNPVTIKIGQDASHNGTVIFSRTSGGGQWLFGAISYIVLSGDAGDGARHFKLAGYGSGVTLANAHDVRISYVNFDDVSRLGDLNPCGVNMEIDHCRAYVTDEGSDHLLQASCPTAATYDSTLKIHDCDLNVPYDPAFDGWGTDCLQISGEGWSVYNSTIAGYAASGTAHGNHQDGIQAASGARIRIYNNRIIDMRNYAIFLEPANGGYTGVRVHGNMCILTGHAQSENIGYAISAQHGLGYNLDDVVVSNNVADGYSSNAFTINDPFPGAGAGAFVNCVCKNNLSVTGAIQVDAQVAMANNTVITTTTAASTHFTSYTTGSASNVYTLKAGSALIGAGTNLTSYFTLDAAGATWPASGAWDIGAFSAGGGGGGGGGSATITTTTTNAATVTVGAP